MVDDKPRLTQLSSRMRDHINDDAGQGNRKEWGRHALNQRKRVYYGG